jgi:hypothetical protein
MTATREQNPHVSPGMPSLDIHGKSLSLFEFWPTWLMYFPVFVQWLALAVRYRSLSLPLIANPAIPLSGMVGAPKSAVFRAAGAYASQWILPWITYCRSALPLDQQVQTILHRLNERGLSLPVVAKPEIGCRGAGVKLIKTFQQLQQYLAGFPLGATLQLQELAAWEAEAGVFYVRKPGAVTGRITSLTLKYLPYISGDGLSTFGELLAADPRAGKLQRLYKARHIRHWDEVPEVGEHRPLVFAASHCRGAIFRDGAPHITAALTECLDKIFADIPEFYYGRLDIKFRDISALQRGEDFVIVEINGASSEPINIWDRNTRFIDAVKCLLRQYRTLFSIAAANRLRGYRPPGLRVLWLAWRHELALVKRYPTND